MNEEILTPLLSKDKEKVATPKNKNIAQAVIGGWVAMNKGKYDLENMTFISDFRNTKSWKAEGQEIKRVKVVFLD